MKSNEPWPDVPDAVRKTMRGNKAKDSKPEMALRRLLHRLGYRFRLHRRALPGTPDIVFPSRRKVIQVHGCYWHGHEGCRLAHIPKVRTEYWGPKIAANRARDHRNEAALASLGWASLTVWECEMTDMALVCDMAVRFLGEAPLQRQAA